MRWLWWGLAALTLTGLGIFSLERTGYPIFRTGDYTWQAIQARGTWRVGLDPSFPPFDLLDSNGQPAGYDVALAGALAARWGVQLELHTIGFDSLLDAVRTGQVDSVVSAYPYDPRLTRDVRFSSPYFEAGIRLAVRVAPEATASITDVADLAGRTVAVEWGSIGDLVGRRLQQGEPTLHLVRFSTPDEAITALVTDPTVDALLIDNVTLRLAQGQGQPIEEVGPVLESNPYVIVLPHTATTLHEQVEQGLQALRTSGELAELEAQWFARVEP